MTSPTVAVVGGSIGGLTAALVLRDLGCLVDVYERTPDELSAHGAGIVVHPETVRYLLERGGLSLDAVSAPSRWVRHLGPDGAVIHEEPSSYRFTAWGTLYRTLLGLFGRERYHRAQSFVGLDQDDDGVDLRFTSGRAVRADLVVLADGILSTGRRRLLPEAGPRYSGYVGWRGTVEENILRPATLELLYDALTYRVERGEHLVAYPIPDLDGVREVGGRLLNWVWYRNVPEGPALDELMTDREGVPRPVSLQPGSVQDRYVAALRADAERILPPPLAEVVVRTPRPFAQAVVDVEVPRMAFGRVCLLGDAAFAARPHAAAGSAKATSDAWALADALESAGGDVPAALRRWEPGRLEVGRRLVARTREMGERSQFRGDWRPGDPNLRFGLYGPGDSGLGDLAR